MWQGSKRAPPEVILFVSSYERPPIWFERKFDSRFRGQIPTCARAFEAPGPVEDRRGAWTCC